MNWHIRIILSFICSFTFMGSALAMRADTVFLLRFGAVPDDGKDDTRALRSAAEYCRTHPGTTLIIPPGIYRLRDAKAEQLENEVLEGKMGGNPEKVIFTPYYPYVRGLDFEGADSITIEGSGATLLCEGWMEPLSIVGCRNFTVRGLTIDYKRKPFSQGIVQQINENSFVVRFDDKRIITNEIPITRITLWDNEISGFYAEPFYFPKRKLLGNNLVEFEGQLPRRMLGASLAALHSFHFRPAIFIGNSNYTVIDKVTIHSQPGMGIVGFDSADIMMRGLSVTPADGFQFSTNTDATHFAACRGTISFDGCFFRGQGDDATNVHGYYHNITSVEDGTITLQLQAPTFTHAQLADVPLEAFYRAVNKVEPSLIRTEADELTYPLHVLIRYEIEKGMFDDTVTENNIEDIWNAKYKEYLGLDVPDAGKGVVQDMHWYGGSIGYFPTYALGSAYAAQILAAMGKDFDVYSAMGDENVGKIAAWLKEHIHKYGSSKSPAEIFECAVGAPFNPHYYIDYLKNKYSKLCGVEE